jgi:dTDP-4-dehydrorhamnose 3,5-epimerase
VSAWVDGPIEGVLKRHLAGHPDERGSFSEVWRESWTAGLGDPMRQANLSRSRARVLRGLHLHRRQADLWLVLEGQPFIALVDVRPALRGERPVTEVLDGQPGDALYIPRGVAHGFYAREDISLLYLVTNEFDGSDELGFAWDDDQAAVPWPDAAPILSPRDAAAPSLADLVGRLRAEGSA